MRAAPPRTRRTQLAQGRTPGRDSVASPSVLVGAPGTRLDSPCPGQAMAAPMSQPSHTEARCSSHQRERDQRPAPQALQASSVLPPGDTGSTRGRVPQRGPGGSAPGQRRGAPPRPTPPASSPPLRAGSRGSGSGSVVGFCRPEAGVCTRESGTVFRQERGPRWDRPRHVLAGQSSEGCGSGSEHPVCRPSTQMAEGPQPSEPLGAGLPGTQSLPGLPALGSQGLGTGCPRWSPGVLDGH